MTIQQSIFDWEIPSGNCLLISHQGIKLIVVGSPFHQDPNGGTVWNAGSGKWEERKVTVSAVLVAMKMAMVLMADSLAP